MDKIHTSHPVFDIESAIIKTRNVPSPVDLKAFQTRIDRICGKTPDGKSKVRVVWGQQATQFIMGRQRMKYPFWRYEEGGEIHDIGTPRFYLEELHVNAELQSAGRWDEARYTWMDGELVDILGPIPSEGFYSPLWCIAHHDDYCCNGKGYIKGEACLGAYRPPVDSDIERIQRMHKRREQAAQSEMEPLDAAQVEKKRLERSHTQDEAYRKKIRETIADYINTRSHSWDTLDPAVLNWGKYHFIGGHNKSGKRKADGSTTPVGAGSLAADLQSPE